jgi:hypothetical protein
MTYFKEIFAYIVSFAVCTLVLVYGVDLPKYITEKPKIVNLYYYTHYMKTFFSEMLIIAIYIIAAELVIRLFKITENAKKLITVNIVTALISGLFVLFYTYFPQTKNYLYRWFKSTKWTYVLYEVIFVGTIYHVYDHILEKI